MDSGAVLSHRMPDGPMLVMPHELSPILNVTILNSKRKVCHAHFQYKKVSRLRIRSTFSIDHAVVGSVEGKQGCVASILC